MEEPKNNLEEEALKRQERLKQLKRKQCDKNKDNLPNKNKAASLPKPKFRSYRPQDKSLTVQVIDTAAPGDVKSEVKDLLDMAKSEMVIDQLDITALAPRQPDWDLKRDVAKKLEKLERRTQRAMAELIRERLREKQDLASIATGEPIK